MTTFAKFLEPLDKDLKGLQFEYFVKWFLENDPEWSTQVDNVWLWDKYLENWGRDCGVDLVFKHKNGETWAVQAKCYSPDYYLTKEDVDKFLSESNRKSIDKRLLIATTDRIGPNAKQVIEAQEKPVTTYLYSDFDQAEIEYPENIEDIHTGHRKEKPDIYDHQLEAVNAVEGGLSTSERGQLIMACGTGKTFTTLWIKERLKSESALILLPSLSLLSQTLREWTFACSEAFDVLCVCSDESVAKKVDDEDETIQSVKNIPFPVESDVDAIARFLSNERNKVIFSTYQSSPLIAEAQLNSSVPAFDLVIADEAHRCSGEVGSAFTTVLDSEKIRASKRLFTTATPRTYSPNLRKDAADRGINVTGMDDETTFGKVLFELNFGEAIKRELLTDYQVVIIGVDQPMIAALIENRELVRTETGKTTDAKALASQIGIIKAIKDYDLKRIISFHSRVKRAELFSSELQDAIEFVNEGGSFNGDIWTDYVSGAMSTYDRRLKLNQLKELSRSERGLLSNARCLAEGVDVPSLDGVAFIDPRSSQVDIVQAVGRAIRLSKDKVIGTIVLPVFIEDGDDPEASIQSSNFKPIWSVLNALKSHDDVLSFELDNMRTQMGRDGDFSKSSDSFSKIVLDLPEAIDHSFANSLRTYLLEKTTASWSFWFGLLEAFVEHEGHTIVPQNFKTPEGFALGKWVNKQRAKMIKGRLSVERKAHLEALLGWVWDVLEFQWEEGLNHLQIFVGREGHMKVPQNFITTGGFALGAWVNHQRRQMVEGQLSIERKARLESLPGWIWVARDEKWEEGFKHLQEFVEHNGHARVPTSFKTEDGYTLGLWVSNRRSHKNQMTDERVAQLESLPGWVWDKLTSLWEEGFAHLLAFVEHEGHTLIPVGFKTESGYKLGSWVTNLRSKKDQISPERKARLEALPSWGWDANVLKWEEGFFHITAFVEHEGHTRVPASYKAADGYNLGSWVQVQRRYKTKNELSTDRIARLEALLGWVWDLLEFQWEEGFEHLQIFVERKRHARVPTSFKTEDGYTLGLWVSNQRRRKGNLS